MAKRKNGEGSWGKKTINGVEYQYYRAIDGHYFYGKTQKEINEKKKDYVPKEAPEFKITTPLAEYAQMVMDKNRITWSETTYMHYTNDIHARIKSHRIGKVAISSVTEAMLQRYINEMSAKYALSTIKQTCKVLRQTFSYAYKHGDIKKNVFEGVLMPNEEHVAHKKKEVPFITKDDLTLLYKECSRKNTAEWKINGDVGTDVYGVSSRIVVFIGHTGLRISELRGLIWRNVDMENRKMRINQALVQMLDKDGDRVEKVKGTKTVAGNRVIPLSDTAMEMLEYFNSVRPNHKPDDFVCVNANGTVPDARNIRRTLDTMLVRAGCSIQTCGLHGLRHGFGSILLLGGVNIKMVSKLLGHSKITTTLDIYINYTEDEISSEVMNVLN